MFRIKLLLIIAGIAMIVIGVQELRLASAAKAEPQVITCEQLAKDGPGDNAHVTLTKFRLHPLSSIYQEKKKRFGKSSGDWVKIWVPAVPAEGAEKLGPALMAPAPSDVRVIVKSTQVKNPQDLIALAGREQISGVITNKIESLGRDERKLLQEGCPGVDLDRCYILEQDRKPADSIKLFGMLGGGLALGLLGGFWMLGGGKKEA